MQKSVEHETAFNANEYGLSPEIAHAYFLIDVEYCEEDASFSHHFGIEKATKTILDEINGTVDLLNHDLVSVSCYSIETLRTLKTSWAQHLLSIAQNVAENALQEV